MDYFAKVRGIVADLKRPLSELTGLHGEAGKGGARQEKPANPARSDAAAWGRREARQTT